VRDGRSKNGGSLNAKRHIAIVTKLWPALGEVSATTGSTVRLKKTRRHMAAHGGTRRNTAEHGRSRQITADHGGSLWRISAALCGTRKHTTHDGSRLHGGSRRITAAVCGSRRITAAHGSRPHEATTEAHHHHAAESFLSAKSRKETCRGPRARPRAELKRKKACSEA
jgi:hypothetical protein